MIALSGKTSEQHQEFQNQIHKTLPSLFPISLYSDCSRKVSLLNDIMISQDTKIAGMAFRCRADAALGFEWVDEGSKRVTGYNHADLVETGQKCLPDLIQPSGRDEVRGLIQDGINRVGTFAIPFGIFTKDRSPAEGILIGRGIFSSPLSLTAIEGYILRMQATGEGQGLPGESERLPDDLWQRMLDHTGDIIAYLGESGTISYITPSVLRILGYRPDQVARTMFTSLLMPDEKTRFEEVRQRIHTGSGGSSARFLGMNANGSPVQLLIRFFASSGSGGSVILTVSQVQDERPSITPSEDLFRVACAASPVPLIITGRNDRRILRVNDGFLKLSGKGNPEEITGLTLLAVGLEATPDDLFSIEAVLDVSGAHDGREMALRTPFGSVPILLSARFFDAAGQEAISWSLVPLPEKESEQKIKIPDSDPEVIRTLILRIRSNLQMLESVMSMKGLHAEEPSGTAIRDMRAFTYALAACYQKATGTQGSDQIPICAYLNDILTNFSDLYEDMLDQITVTNGCGGDWSLGTATGVPVGLMVTELLINSARHAFSREEDGRIEVSFTREEDWYILEVKDSGRGLPDEVTHGQPIGAGLAMVEDLAMQLSGTANFSNDGGARVRIIFPEKKP